LFWKKACQKPYPFSRLCRRPLAADQSIEPAKMTTDSYVIPDNYTVIPDNYTVIPDLIRDP